MHKKDLNKILDIIFETMSKKQINKLLININKLIQNNTKIMHGGVILNDNSKYEDDIYRNEIRRYYSQEVQVEHIEKLKYDGKKDPYIINKNTIKPIIQSDFAYYKFYSHLKNYLYDSQNYFIIKDYFNPKKNNNMPFKIEYELQHPTTRQIVLAEIINLKESLRNKSFDKNINIKMCSGRFEIPDGTDLNVYGYILSIVENFTTNNYLILMTNNKNIVQKNDYATKFLTKLVKNTDIHITGTNKTITINSTKESEESPNYNKNSTAYCNYYLKYFLQLNDNLNDKLNDEDKLYYLSTGNYNDEYDDDDNHIFYLCKKLDNKFTLYNYTNLSYSHIKVLKHRPVQHVYDFNIVLDEPDNVFWGKDEDSAKLQKKEVDDSSKKEVKEERIKILNKSEDAIPKKEKLAEEHKKKLAEEHKKARKKHITQFGEDDNISEISKQMLKHYLDTGNIIITDDAIKTSIDKFKKIL
jgi:hypothetical protein